VGDDELADVALVHPLPRLLDVLFERDLEVGRGGVAIVALVESAFAMMASSFSGRSSFTERAEGISPLSRRWRMVMSGTPFHSRLPVAISHIITPTEKMSARRSTRSPRACSGAMYATLPLMTPSPVSVTRFFALARPKSMIFGCPS